jgi:hypothetical protein
MVVEAVIPDTGLTFSLNPQLPPMPHQQHWNILRKFESEKGLNTIFKVKILFLKIQALFIYEKNIFCHVRKHYATFFGYSFRL